MSSEKIVFDTTPKRTSKRCPRGSRKEKKAQVCVQYTKVKTFTNLKDQNISETETTVSVEGLGEKNKDGAIIKLYHKGDLHSQKYVSPEKVKKAQQKTIDQIKKSKEVMKKISKNPELMFKDKKFRQFQKKMDDAYKKSKRKNKTMKGGDGDSSGDDHIVVSPDKTKINMDINLVPNADTERKETMTTHLPYDNWWSSIMWGNLFMFSSDITAPVRDWVINPMFGFDVYGSLFMTLLSTMPSLFPGVQSVDTLVTIAQYVFYTVYIPLNILSLGGFGIALSILPAINLFRMTFGNKPPTDTLITNDELHDMKNQQNQQNQTNELVFLTGLIV